MSEAVIESLGARLEALRSGKIKEGLRLDLRTDEFFRYKQGTFNIWLGLSNTGKTHFQMFLFLCWTIKHNIRWLIWSSENKPEYLMRKVIEFANGQLLTDMTSEKLQRELMYYGQFFRFMNTEETETAFTLTEKAEEEYRKDPFDALNIDPYNSLALDRELTRSVGTHEAHLETATHLRNFAKKMNVSIWLAMHPNSGAARVKHSSGEYNGLPKMPTEHDVDGGSKFVNRADDFYISHRYIHHPTDWMWTHLAIAKVKEYETGGHPTPFDDPIRFRSTKNNLGFELDGSDIITKLQKKDKQAEMLIGQEPKEDLPF